MDVFEWVRYSLAAKPPTIELEAILVVLVHYGATSDQKFIKEFLTKSSALAHVLNHGRPDWIISGLRCLSSLASRKLVAKDCWEWCYSASLALFSESLTVLSKDAHPELVDWLVLCQCLKTLNSLLALRTPSAVPHLLSLLRETLTYGMFSVPSSRSSSSKNSLDEVSSDDEGVARQPAAQLVVGTSSDSEVSDSEYYSSLDLKTRAWSARVRQRSYQCLYSLLHGMDHKEVFSYWSMFLSNSNDPSMPTILTCLIRESTSKVRMTIAMALSALLEGIKPLLSPADDRPLLSCAFIPYSHWLGGVIKEVHRVLLLAASTEGCSKTLLQILKCTSALLANVPYSRLVEPYQTRMASSLKPLLSFRNVDVRVACFTCFNSMLSNECGAAVREWIARCVNPTLPEVCSEQLLPKVHPQVIQIASLQLLAAMAKNHPHCLLGVFYKLLEQLALCTEVLELSIHAFQVIEEFWKSRQNAKDLMSSEEACKCWSALLEGSVGKQLQGSHYPSISSCCDLLATIGTDVMAKLKGRECVFVLSMVVGAAKYEPHQVQASAVRTLGVYVQYPNLQADVSFLLDAAHIICMQVGSKDLSVRVQAAWSLGNLCDSLRGRRELLTPNVYAQLMGAALATCKDHEKVRVNTARALGHLLFGLQEAHLSMLTPEMNQCIDFLSKTISSGAAKIRWNGCHAAASALSSAILLQRCKVEPLISTLAKTLYTCKNFKVRVSAVSALCSVASYPDPVLVWDALLLAIKASEEMKDFSEFKHQSTLQFKLCDLFRHLMQSTPDELKGKVEAQVNENTEYIAAFVGKLKPSDDDSSEADDDELTKLRRAAEKHGLPSLVVLFAPRLKPYHRSDSNTSQPCVCTASS